MNNLSSGCLAMGLLVSASLPSLASSTTVDPGVSTLKITIHVYDYVQVSPAILAQAEREVSRIFGKAGVEILWLDNSPCATDPQSLDECREPLGPTDFSLRILSRIMAQRMDPDDGTLGFSLPCQEGQAGCVANVFYHHVESLARAGNGAEWQILGHAMAHEMGHLLLRMKANSHSPSGLMRAKWGLQDFKQAAFGELLFTRAQATLIREEAFRRGRQQAALRVSGLEPTR
jgi:hypothetical protein